MYLVQMLPKFLLALIILLIYVKISGKSQIAPMSQLDQVGSMVIGALVGAALLSPSVSTWEAASVVIIWSGLLVLVRFLKSKNSKFRNIIDGCPVQLIKDGKLLCENFIKANLSVRDFQTLINIQGISSFGELKYVWYELNGSLTIIKQGEKNIASLLVEDGVINEDNLKNINKNESWLKKEISKEGLSIEDVFCVEFFDDGLSIYPKSDTCKSMSDESTSKGEKPV